mgnify:CR=1 FL=1
MHLAGGLASATLGYRIGFASDVFGKRPIGLAPAPESIDDRLRYRSTPQGAGDSVNAGSPSPGDHRASNIFRSAIEARHEVKKAATGLALLQDESSVDLITTANDEKIINEYNLKNNIILRNKDYRYLLIFISKILLYHLLYPY